MEFSPLRTFFTILIFVICSGALETEFDKIVATKNGPVQGILKTSRNASVKYVSFMGLRYADPPARFEPAKPLTETWYTNKVARTPGNACIQPQYTGGAVGSDDCLFLNVHVPESALNDPSKNLPVMFWVHGGSFTTGNGHSFDVKYLMENENVIVVTTNYRLGVLGFITTGNQSDLTFTSNNGLRDLVQALRWTRENIAAFRGDSDRVTLFGVSAGSAAVHFLLMSPLAKYLFSGAILQSGSFSFWSYQPNPAKYAVNFAKALNCSNVTAEDALGIRKCLESKTPVELMHTQQSTAQRWPATNSVSRFLPTAKERPKNAFFYEDPTSYFSPPGPRLTTFYLTQVPVIIGLAKDEGSSLFAAFLLQHKAALNALNTNWTQIAPKMLCYEDVVPEEKWPALTKKIRDFYFGNKTISKESAEQLVQIYSDTLMLLPIMYSAKEMAQKGMRVYPYIYAHEGPTCFTQLMGVPCMPGKVGHGDEVQHLFAHPMFAKAEQMIEGKPEEKKFSQNLVKMWTAFAETGTPDGVAWGGKNVSWEAAQTWSDGRVKLDILEIDNNLRKYGAEFEDRLEFWRDAINSGE